MMATHLRRPTRLAAALATATALALFADGACSYSPNIESGSLICSAEGECPRGFTCASSGPRVGRCVTGSGTTGTGGSGAGGTGGSGGSGGSGGIGGIGGSGVLPSPSASSYIGTWVFDSAATVYSDCGAAYTPQTDSLAGSALQISATVKGAAILAASWSTWDPANCDYELRLDGRGLHLNDSSWSCQDTTQDPAAYWQIQSFEVVTSNGLTATHDAQYSQRYVYADGTKVNCAQTVHAVMNRQ